MQDDETKLLQNLLPEYEFGLVKFKFNQPKFVLGI